MRKLFIYFFISVLFFSCQTESTEIQIYNGRQGEKIFNYGLTTYFGESGPVYNAERVYVEHGEMCNVIISVFRRVTSSDIESYDLVNEIFINQIAPYSLSEIFELERCDRIEILYRTYAYDYYYHNSVEIAAERIFFDQTAVFDKIRKGSMNKLTIKY